MTPATLPVTLIDLPQFAHRLSHDAEDLNDLATSIRKSGLIYPITVKPAGDRYEIIAGERRFRAHLQLQLPTIDCMIREGSDAQDTETIKAVENFQRASLTPIEEARALAQMRDVIDLTVDQIAANIGRRPAWVEQRLSLLELPDDLGPHVHAGTITITNAVLLATCDDEQHRRYLTGYALVGGATSTTLRAWIDDWRLQRQIAQDTNAPPPQIDTSQPPPPLMARCATCGDPHDIANMRVLRVCCGCAAEITNNLSGHENRA